ncbi:TM1266 family iron-only hydrogenase system putative regulator [Emergencia sp. 1XD21-10]|uniref:TM1266 family iron-only hydrogenase system putative regulator n=1 Tax=Emergencia sp. 1XD21-10 TaxID=2304569 RepID=UPI00137948B3|nr:TM1266 family iron-only hydrogenase system putative regulator [Emergencia sp. 1XD21-10]NCE99903.1 iron-only hydrogenase system regulator [Emergencia sp. 1XD21-10]
MENRVALVSIIVKDLNVVEELNDMLHQYSSYIIGRMGLPYREKEMHIISVAIDAPSDSINALSGKIGKLPGISSKVAYANE